MKKLLFASSDYLVKGTITECMKKNFSYMECFDVTKDCELKFHVAFQDETILLIDKFFLGYSLQEKIASLKAINPKLRIIFIEKNLCSIFFAMRVYNLHADGYICNVENIKTLAENLNSIFSGKNYFPDIVKNAIDCGENLENRYCGELTDRELIVAIMLGQGYSVKEIAIEIQSSSHNISNYIHYIRRKIGSKSDADFKEIYDEMLNRVLGGWNC